MDRSEHDKETKMPPRLPRLSFSFAALKALARAEGNPRDCPHGECRRRKRCTGGPRGTFRRLGKPLCCSASATATIQARRQRRADKRAWQRLI